MLFIDFLGTALRHFLFLTALFWGHALLAIAFVVFVVQNKGSLVLGDSSNHESCFHLVQLFYFAVAVVGLADPGCLIRLSFWAQLRRKMLSLTGILCLVVAALCVWQFSFIHRFLLADNRHYTFYWARLVFRKWWWMRYALVPVYCAACAAAYSFLGYIPEKDPKNDKQGMQQRIKIGQHRVLVRPLILFAAAGAVVLTPLVEVRYFALPYIMVMLHVHPSQPCVSNSAVVMSCLVALIVNAITVWVFVFKPFRGVDEEQARWMW